MLEIWWHHRRESNAKCLMYEERRRRKKVFSVLCNLLPRILPVSADFLMSSAGGNENTSEATADRPLSVVWRKTLQTNLPDPLIRKIEFQWWKQGAFPLSLSFIKETKQKITFFYHVVLLMSRSRIINFFFSRLEVTDSEFTSDVMLCFIFR